MSPASFGGALQAPVSRDPLASPLELLQTLFGAEAPGSLVLWRRRERRSVWIPAARLDRPLPISDAEEDLYFGVALQDQDRALRAAGRAEPANVRGGVASSLAIPAVWADVDIRGPAHSRHDLPSTLDDARELLDSFPLATSIVIDSGYGLQAYWLFKEPWLLANAEDREVAQAFSRRFQATLQAGADERGWRIDNTSDLARVLRLPGTVNTKLGERRPVRIIDWQPERRYEPSEFERYLVTSPKSCPDDERERVDTAAILRGVPEGERDSKLFRFACKLRGADVPRGVAEELVLKAASRAQPPFPKKEALAKVASAYDRYPAGRGPVKASAALAGFADEPPRPLLRPPSPAPRFPTDALGEVLGAAARAIQEKTQAPHALCGQSVLAAAALSTQGHANVELPTGSIRPVSISLVTVLETGERKSSADALALAPVRERESVLERDYARDRPTYENAHAAWEKQRGQCLANRKSTQAEKRQALENLGPEPIPPLLPLLTCPDPTIEGLFKLYATGQPSLGVFSAEGGQFIGGHGMNPDNRLRTAAALSALWDGEPLKRVRAGDPIGFLSGRRLAIHLLVQPAVASLLLTDSLLRSQGVLSRLLVAAPDGTSGSRFWRETSEEAERRLVSYHQRLREILTRPLPLAEGARNELKPRIVRLAPLARDLWINFADDVERRLGPGGEYEPIRGLANKLPEHAARLATVIALVEDLKLSELAEHHLARGIELAEHYAQEGLRLFESGSADPNLQLANRLLQWLQRQWAEDLVSLPDVYQRGPRPIRNQKEARRFLGILVEHGWLQPVPGGGTVDGHSRREVWRIVRS